MTLFSHPTACFRSGFFTGVCFWFFTGCDPFLPRHHQLIRGKKKCLRAASGVGIAVGWSTNSSFASISMRNNCASHCGISNAVLEKWVGYRGVTGQWQNIPTSCGQPYTLESNHLKNRVLVQIASLYKGKQRTASAVCEQRK